MKQNKIARFFRNPVVIGAGLLTAAGTASADVAADIATAVGGATTNVSAAAGGVVVVAAVMLGVGVIVSLFRK